MTRDSSAHNNVYCESPMIYAPPLTRLAGQAIDAVVALLPLLLILPAGFFGDGGVVLALGGVAGSVLYYFFADAFPNGQSIGKQMLGMAVVDAETGYPCTPWQSFLRNVLLAMLGPIDWIFIFGRKTQRLGDMAAGTVVISVPR